MSKNTTLVNKVLDFRKEQQMTQEELADAIGVSRQTIISIEKGKFVPSVKLALQIARHFKVSTDKVFFFQ